MRLFPLTSLSNYPITKLLNLSILESVNQLLMTRTPRSPAEIEAAVADLKRQLENLADRNLERIDCNSETIEQGLAKLVLGIMELLRRLLERQAVRRMEGGSLSDE